MSLDYRELAPPPSVARYVKCVWVMTGNGGPESSPQPIVPDGCTEVIFNFADRFTRHHGDDRERQSTELVVGQMSKVTVVEPGQKIDLVGIRFHPWGARPLLGLPLPDLQERIEALELVPRGSAHELGDRLADVRNVEQRGAIALGALATLAAHRPAPDPMAELLVENLKRRHGSPTVQQLARDIGRSTRQVQRVFAETLGIAPRNLLRVVRFQRALRAARSGRRRSWASVAAEAGYFDQAHLVRESHRLAGCSPTEFARTDRSFADNFLTD